MTAPQHAPWFGTTPEAILRAESMLLALSEGRLADIGAIIASDDGDANPHAATHTFVALLTMADRLADYGARIGEHTHRDLLRETARTVAQAIYTTTEGK